MLIHYTKDRYLLPKYARMSRPSTPRLIGPFAQVLPMDGLPKAGPIADDALSVLDTAGILVADGRVERIGSYAEMRRSAEQNNIPLEELDTAAVALPGLVDAHTHLCFAGSRAADYALRVGGASYEALLARGGGIHESVRHTRAAPIEELEAGLAERCQRLLRRGVTTVEVKSGYGLSVEAELKQLRAISAVAGRQSQTIAATCLAAHVLPKEFEAASTYLNHLLEALLPVVKEEGLAERVDIFVEPAAFPPEVARPYLEAAQSMGFELVIHADQFHRGGSGLAVEVGARSADHLEASTSTELTQLAEAGVIGVALPGASMGLGMPYPAARTFLDAGGCLAIASDWNPGSAPMGDLLLQAAVMGAAEKLSIAETLAAITRRAAMALNRPEAGCLAEGLPADITAFPCEDYREILYRQGMLRPLAVWKDGQRVHTAAPAESLL